MKRFLAGTLACLLTVFVVVACDQSGLQDPVSESQSFVAASSVEVGSSGKEYGWPNADFSDNRVLIVLTDEASLAFKRGEREYTAESFPEIDAAEVEHLTASMNVTILLITLSENGKENVLEAVEALKSREDVKVAEPDYLYKIID